VDAWINFDQVRQNFQNEHAVVFRLRRYQFFGPIIMASPNHMMLDETKRRAGSIASSSYGCYALLFVPVILFLGSLYIPPTMSADSLVGFLVLHNMLGGGAFNCFTEPDPANIANDVVTFLTIWSPGQYLVPGIFISFGTDFGLALSLVALIATLIGVLGWIQVARSFAVSSFVLFVFVVGLSTFSYVTLPFRTYTGGEVLLFAVAPWSLYAMRWAANKPPIFTLAISLLSAAVLFVAKLSGLIVFAANVGAISLLALASQRRLSLSTIAMWVASATALLCFLMFWIVRGPVATSESTFTLSWFPLLFSLSAVAFSGISGFDFLEWSLGHPWAGIIFGFDRPTKESLSHVLGPLGLLFFVWVWIRLRHTRYRDMAALLLTIILLYAIVMTAILLRGQVLALVTPQEWYFRYAGILSFLLLLTAIDQWRLPLAKGLAWVLVVMLGLFGLKQSATGALAQMRANHATYGIYQDVVSPAILDYLRSEIARNSLHRPIAVLPSLRAALTLPARFRILRNFMIEPLEYSVPNVWAGRAERIFVIVPQERLLDGEAQAMLRSFTGYSFDNWRQMKLDGMIIYTQ